MMHRQRIWNNALSWICNKKKGILLALVLCLGLSSLAGATPLIMKISGDMSDLSDVSELSGGFQLTSDNQKVVFLSNRDNVEIPELFVVPVKGGTILKLNQTIASGGKIADYKITPDGTRVIYLADVSGDETTELYSVSITGGTIASFSGEWTGYVKDFLITPDSQKVVFSTNNLATPPLTKKLFVAPVTGTEDPISIAQELGVNAVILDYDISDNSNWVVFRATGIDPDPKLYGFDLHAASNLADLAGIDKIDSFKIAPLSQRVVYASGYNLYSVDLSGLPVDRQVLWTTPSTLHAYAVTPNSVYTVFKVTLADSSVNLLSIPTAGGGLYYPAPSLPTWASIGTFSITPNSERIVFIVDRDAEDQNELFSNQTTGDDLQKLNGDLVEGGDVYSFKISPNSQDVVYLADQAIDNVIELFSNSTPGGSWVRLNPISTSARVTDFAISPDSAFVVYTSNQDLLSMYEIFYAPISGGKSYQLNDTILVEGDVESYKISADSKKIVYLADQEVFEKYELFTSILGMATFMPVVMK